MLDGIYHVTFSASGGAGDGLAVIKGDTINGGDAGYLYRGRLVQQGDQVSGTLQIHRWNPGGVSVFGPLDRFELQLLGAVAPDRSFTVQGAISNQPNLRITIRGQRLVDAA